MKIIKSFVMLASCLPVTSAALAAREAQVASTSTQQSPSSTSANLSSVSDTSAAFFAQTTTPSPGQADGTSIAVFTVRHVPFTATVVSSVVQLAGYQLQVGEGALINGVQVTVASSGIIEDGQLWRYSTYNGSSTSLVSTSTTFAADTTAASTSVMATSSSSRAVAVATKLPLNVIAAMGVAVVGMM